jgi:hypothetical protein
MEITIPVPVGEIVDKLSILDIKLEKIADPERRAFITKERDLVLSKLAENNIKPYQESLFTELKKVNELIWETEENLRKNFSIDNAGEFILHARNNGKFNDQRFVIKHKINKQFNSVLQEQKAHDWLYKEE